MKSNEVMSDTVKTKSNLPWILGIVGASFTLLHAFNCLCPEEYALLILGTIGLCFLFSLFGKCKLSRLFGVFTILITIVHVILVLDVLAATEVQLIALVGDAAFIASGIFGILNGKRGPREISPSC